MSPIEETSWFDVVGGGVRESESERVRDVKICFKRVYFELRQHSLK